MKPLIYFIEDDKNINTLIEATLTRNNFDSRGFLNPVKFFEALESAQVLPDLIILDIMLPEINGYDCLKRLKRDEKYSSIPVIFLTAKSSETDIVQGLDMGASDYITKPFGLLEFVSRINANLRKVYSNNNNTLTVRNLTLNLNKYKLYYKDNPITITSKEFELMKMLMSSPSIVITRSAIFNKIWGNKTKLDIDSTRTLDMHIKFLREKIAEYTDEVYIETIRGIGYVINE